MAKPTFTNDGITEWFYVFLFCGVPFGIGKMFLLLPSGGSLAFSLGIWTFNVLVGGLIGGVILIWRLLVAVYYIPYTIFCLVVEKNTRAIERINT